MFDFLSGRILGAITTAVVVGGAVGVYQGMVAPFRSDPIFVQDDDGKFYIRQYGRKLRDNGGAMDHGLMEDCVASELSKFGLKGTFASSSYFHHQADHADSLSPRSDGKGEMMMYPATMPGGKPSPRHVFRMMGKNGVPMTSGFTVEATLKDMDAFGRYITGIQQAQAVRVAHECAFDNN